MVKELVGVESDEDDDAELDIPLATLLTDILKDQAVGETADTEATEVVTIGDASAEAIMRKIQTQKLLEKLQMILRRLKALATVMLWGRTEAMMRKIQTLKLLEKLQMILRRLKALAMVLLWREKAMMRKLKTQKLILTRRIWISPWHAWPQSRKTFTLTNLLMLRLGQMK